MNIRVCPKCNQEITYSNKSKYDYAVKRNTKCKECKECREYKCKDCNIKIQRKNKTQLCLQCYSKYLKNNRIASLEDPLGWVRKCPQCNIDIKYNSITGYYVGKKKNSICVKCHKENVKKNIYYCKECNNKIYEENITGCCGKCYNELKKQEYINIRTYHYSRCNKDIYSNNNKVTQKNINRGYCYNCLNEEKKFISIERICELCNKKFIINNYNKKKNKTCSLECKVKKKTLNFINKVSKIYNNRYDYNKVNYKNSNDKIIVTCKTHGDFLINPHNHLNGRGCSKCCLYISKGEYNIIEYFKVNKIDYVHQKQFDDCRNPITNYKLKYDFYIPHKNLLIEFDGEQHYRIGAKVRNHILTEKEVENIKIRDKLKDEYAVKNNIKLLRIPYTKLKEIDKILSYNL